jgi:hypothetical protein
LFPIVGNKIARRARELLKVDGKPKMTGRDGLQMRECICQRAPFRVQDIEHVVVTPFWHLTNAATHCLKSFASYDGKRSLSHLFVLPVTSLAGEHETKTTAKPTRTTMRRMRPPKLERPIKQVRSAWVHPPVAEGERLVLKNLPLSGRFGASVCYALH